jgi:hypothetical protein
MRINIKQLFILLLFIGIFMMTLRPITDPDFWWHLRTGELIAQTRSIPHFDPFSFTNNGKLWVAHEWLTEISMYGLYKIGSYGLLILVFSAFITGAFLFSYLRSPRDSTPYAAGFVVLLGVIATAPTWGVRPQMVSLLLTSLLLFLLERYLQRGRLAYVLPIPVLVMVWVNLHAGYLMGLALIALFIIGGLLELLASNFLKNLSVDPPALRSILVLCVVLGASVLAALVNPNGLHILIYPFQTLSSPSMQKLIQEWFSTDFHLMQWQPFALFILLLIGAGMFTGRRLSITKILLVLLLGYAALRSMRNIPLFVIAAIPVLSEQIGSFLNIPSAAQSSSRLFRWLAPICLALFILVAGFRFVQVLQEQSISATASFPGPAVDWIIDNEPAGNIFNTYGWGGYLIWRLYPQYHVYIDGRADVYGDAFIFDFISIQNAQKGWEEKLASRDVHTILIEPDTPLAGVLRITPGWVNVYEDKTSVIFLHL